MPDYDFHQLSPIEFEELTLDLLQKELDITFEKFSAGRDQGIDLRHSKSLDGKTKIVVQCKHYVKSPWSQLKNKLQDEKEKVKALDPERYLFCTSQGLSPERKDEILQIFEPYIKNTADIWGRDDFNNLLGKFPDIEKKNYKLWFASTEVVQRILNNALYTFSEFTEADIVRTINTYVQTEHFDLAIELLQENRCCILVGDPGVGKTTLAKMLIYQYLLEGYELVVCSEDIREGMEIFAPGKSQIFYYDDFLGQTAYTQLGKNEETRLSQFIQRVRESKNKIFVLTSRDYILQRGLQETELLNADQVDILSLVLDMNQVATINKGLILYNHLYYSELGISYIEPIINERSYLKIINHRNYSPRLIETMTDIRYLQNNEIHGESYLQEFIRNLDNPERIWEIAFSSHIDDDCRNILYSLTLFRFEAEIRELYEFINKSLSTPILLWKTYKRCLDILDGTFIRSRLGRFQQGKIVISFQSPSIKDFLENQLVIEKEVFEILLRTSSESQLVEVLRNMKFRNVILENNVLIDILKDFSWNIYGRDGLSALKILVQNNVIEKNVLTELFEEVIDNLEYFLDDIEDLLELIPAIIQEDQEDEFHYQVEQLVDRLAEDENSFINGVGATDPFWVVHNFYCVMMFLDSLSYDYLYEMGNLQNQFEEIVYEYIGYYSSIGVTNFSLDTSPNTDEIEFCGNMLGVATGNLIEILDELFYQNDKLSKLDDEKKINNISSGIDSIDNLFSTLLDQ